METCGDVSGKRWITEVERRKEAKKEGKEDTVSEEGEGKRNKKKVYRCADE